MTLNNVVTSLWILHLFRIGCMTELCLNWSGGGIANLVREWVASPSLGNTCGSRSLSKGGLVIILSILYQILTISTILFCNNDCLPIQEILVSLTTVWIVWIWEIPWIVLTIDHLDSLGLAELNILLLLLLFDSCTILLVHLIRCIALLLRGRLVRDKIGGLTFDRLGISLGHITRISPHKGTRLRVPRIMSISKFIKRTLWILHHHLISLHPLLVLCRIDLLEARTNHVVKLIPLRLVSLPFDVSLLFCHHRVLVLSPVELICLVLFHFLLSSLAQVEHGNCLEN